MHPSHCLAHSSRLRLIVAAVVCAATLVSVPSAILPAAASPQAPGPGPRQAFTLAQTLSDEAQRTTIAFSGLAMMTGNLEAQSFFPPGKVADYTGFQYLRDNDPDGMGHNTSFLTRVANNVIYVLNDSQFAQLKALATGQIDQIDLYGYKRFPLMKAFRRLLQGDVPAGSTGLNLEAVKTVSRELYILDGQISFDRALLYAAILNSLDSTQMAYLAAMKGKGWSSWPDITNDQVSAKMRGLPQGTSVAVMTYASDLFSWYAGSVEADVYFCPERQGTYYGSFYIKDAPAIGHEGYSIDEALTATAGAAMSDSSKGYVTPAQATLMSSLVDTQRANLYASSAFNIVKIRTEIATLLRTLLTPGVSSDAVKSRVLELSGIYGDLDGENNYAYATVFTQVFKTLSADQKIKMAALRKSIMSGTYSDGTPFDFSVCTAPFLYSSVITNVGVLSPYIADTDYLFQTGTAQTAPIVTWTTPESVVAGTALSVIQLNATANVPGTFVYTPSVGTVLVAGTQTLSVTFAPTDTTNYATATATVSIVVTTAGGESAFVGPRAGGGWSGTISGASLVYHSVTYPIVNGRVTFPDCTMFIVAPNGALAGGANIAGCTPIDSGTGTSETGTGGSATGGSGTSGSGAASGSASGSGFAGPRSGGGWSGTISGSSLVYNSVTYPIVNGRVTFPDCTMFIVAPNGALAGGATIPNCLPNDRLAADAVPAFAGFDAR